MPIKLLQTTKYLDSHKKLAIETLHTTSLFLQESKKLFRGDRKKKRTKQDVKLSNVTRIFYVYITCAILDDYTQPRQWCT